MIRAATLTLLCAALVGAAPDPAPFHERFAQGLSAWEPVRVADTRADRIEVEQGHLVLSLDTLGTRDETVKLRGVRSKRAWTIPAEGPPLRIEVELDWNAQRNGCYLSAGFALVPPRPAPRPGSLPPPEQAPHDLPAALAFEFVGVPPGKNARPFLWWRKARGLRPLYTEGWPQPKREERTGRKVARTRVTLELSAERVRLLEGKKELYAGAGVALEGPHHLLLFVRGHSNYAARTVLFHEARVDRAPAKGER